MKKSIFLTLIITLATSGCSLVKLSPQADQVRLMTAQSASHCRILGTTTVSVMNSVFFVDRDRKKIQGELEIMARNSAAKMGGDTASPDNGPIDGEQSYTVYQCIYGGH